VEVEGWDDVGCVETLGRVGAKLLGLLGCERVLLVGEKGLRNLGLVSLSFVSTSLAKPIA
jgi:hypothetical protein